MLLTLTRKPPAATFGAPTNRVPRQRFSARRHWLCVAYAFPPINRSGTHRTLGFVDHLDRLGWDAAVVTVEPDHEPVDETLLDQVPASANVIRTRWVDLIAGIKAALPLRMLRSLAPGEPRALARAVSRISDADPAPAAQRGVRDWITRLLVTPDARVGWVVPGVRAAMHAVRRRRPDVIYSTAPCMSAHLIALMVSQRTALPWVADFRDPWRGNPFRDLRYGGLDRWDAWLEERVLRRATHVVCNTGPMKEQLCRRAPFVARKCTAIMNGFDARRLDGVEPRRLAPVEDFVLTHTGQFYGPRSPKVWFRALRRVIEQSPKRTKRMHMVLVGAESFNGQSLTGLAARSGVGHCVRVLGPRGHAEALSLMSGSDALMLAGSVGVDGEVQVPGKLFEYLALRRPIIAAVSADSPAVDILTTARAEALIVKPDDEQGLAAAITQLAQRRHAPPENAWSGVAAFERAHRAQELAAIFAQVAGVRALCR